MVHHLVAAAEVRVLVAERVEAVRAAGDDLGHARLVERRHVLLGVGLEEVLVAHAPRRVAGARLARAEDREVDAGRLQQPRRRLRRRAGALVERGRAADPVEDLGRAGRRARARAPRAARPSRRARSAACPRGCRRARRRAASARPRRGSATPPSRGGGAGRRCGRRARSRPGTRARRRRRSRSPRRRCRSPRPGTSGDGLEAVRAAQQRRPLLEDLVAQRHDQQLRARAPCRSSRPGRRPGSARTRCTRTCPASASRSGPPPCRRRSAARPRGRRSAAARSARARACARRRR